MILSHKYQFIFIKTGKVGGTSVEMALSRFLGPDDIITPISRADELERYRLGYRSAQNFEKPFTSLSPVKWPRWLRAAALSRLGSGERSLRERYRFPRRFWNHMPAAAIRARIDKDIWDRYYKFSIERNPWDKTISTYFWDLYKEKHNMSFRDFVLSGQGLNSHFNHYSINGVVAVDRLLRYERIAQEIGEVAQHLGFPNGIRETIKDLNAKTGYRPNRRVVDHYDEEIRKIAEIYYAREIRLMGFKFGEEKKGNT